MKKNRFRLFGIIAAVALIWFSLAACDTGSTGGSGGGGGGGTGSGTPPPPPTANPNDGPAFLGSQLLLQGRVYQGSWGSDYNFITTPFNGSLTDLSAGFWHNGDVISLGGSGAVSNGQLNFSLGVPATMPMSVGQFFGTNETFNTPFGSFTFSNASVGIAPVDRLRVSTYGAQILFETPGLDQMSFFVYVASDVTISGTGRTFTNNNISWTGTTFTLNLQQGWNAFRLVSELNANGTAARVSVLPGSPAGAVWVLWSAGGQ